MRPSVEMPHRDIRHSSRLVVCCAEGDRAHVQPALDLLAARGVAIELLEGAKIATPTLIQRVRATGADATYVLCESESLNAARVARLLTVLTTESVPNEQVTVLKLDWRNPMALLEYLDGLPAVKPSPASNPPPSSRPTMPQQSALSRPIMPKRTVIAGSPVLAARPAEATRASTSMSTSTPSSSGPSRSPAPAATPRSGLPSGSPPMRSSASPSTSPTPRTPMPAVPQTVEPRVAATTGAREPARWPGEPSPAVAQPVSAEQETLAGSGPGGVTSAESSIDSGTRKRTWNDHADSVVLRARSLTRSTVLAVSGAIRWIRSSRQRQFAAIGIAATVVLIVPAAVWAIGGAGDSRAPAGDGAVQRAADPVEETVLAGREGDAADAPLTVPGSGDIDVELVENAVRNKVVGRHKDIVFAPLNPKKMSFRKGQALCEELAAGGIDDFRLASLSELHRLTSDGVLPKSSTYWSGTESDGFDKRALVWSAKKTRAAPIGKGWRGAVVVCVRSQRAG